MRLTEEAARKHRWAEVGDRQHTCIRCGVLRITRTRGGTVYYQVDGPKRWQLAERPPCKG